MSTATAWRYVNETVALPVARDAGHACVVLGGTLIPIDHVAAGRPF